MSKRIKTMLNKLYKTVDKVFAVTYCFIFSSIMYIV